MAAISQHNLQMLNTSTYAHSIAGMPHGLGLLTTVASLPPKYRSRYLNIKTKCEIPLDLSRKSLSPQLECEVPMAANFTEVYTEPCSDTASQNSEDIIDEISQQCEIMSSNNHTQTNTTTTTTATITVSKTPENPALQQESQQLHQQHNKPITPPLTPTKKRKFSDSSLDTDVDSKENQKKVIKLDSNKVKQPLVENTPHKPIKTLETPPRTGKNHSATNTTKANRSNKATKKLKFDEETSSPVSGTIIRPLEDITDGTMQYSNGDIDPKYNIVEITEETKAELAAIKNVIGDYVCRLCRIKFDDAFGLAQHRCACIVLLEYRCPECGKQFNCPANLASHRRWHKPRKDGTVTAIASNSTQTKKENKEQKSYKKSDENETIYNCSECGKKFKRQAYLKKHLLTHQQKSETIKNPQESITSAENTQSSIISLPTATNLPVQQPQQLQVKSEIVNSSEIIHHTNHSNHSLHHQPPSYDDQDDSMSDYSSTTSSQGYGRLQIIEPAGLTEEENIAAAALTNLRNCASVIQHTTLAH